jgi:HEAT repeat protein
MGPAAVQAVPVLIEIIKRNICISVTDTPKAFFWPMSSEKYICNAAAEALGEIGPGAIKAIPSLIQLLEESDNSQKEAAYQALIKITGKDLGNQTEPWQKWWEVNKPK